ncbi:MAG: class I SAM-dependent methyltransferase [archaeon]|nr:class I SAM-dependent methyltransferase [archaeon]
MSLRQKLIDALFYDSLFRGIDFNTVLDVGSGNGKMIDYFESKEKKVTAIDLAPTRKDIIKMDIFKNDFEKNSFDLVYSAHVIEHLKEPEKFAEELFRISKKYVCIITPYPSVHFWDQPDHIRPYTPETLKRIFHLDGTIHCFHLSIPLFESISIILFEKQQSRMAKKEKK